MNDNFYTNPGWCDKDIHKIFNLCMCYFVKEEWTLFTRACVALWQSNSGVYPGQLETYPHKNLYLKVYGSIIYSSQTVEMVNIISQLMNG